MGARRKAREKALRLLFQLDFRKDDVERVCEEFWSANPAGPKVREFAEKLVRGTCANRENIDQMIASTIENWTMERLGAVDRTILRVATFELMHMPDIPPKVTINEAIEIAKAYGSEKSGRFINGVLDRIREKLGKSIAFTGLPENGSNGT
jgi:N utilization substance protein B